MPSINLQKLKEVIRRSYREGYEGSLDMEDSYVNETISSLMKMPSDSGENEGWMIFTAKNLRQSVVGTIFEHISMGKCWVENNATEKYMVFHTGEIIHFYNDESPWDEPMRIISHVTKKVNKNV